MNILKTLVAVVALLPIVANAQVNYRRGRQHARIAQGVHSGALTHHEARGLRYREHSLHATERRARFFHGGHLTSSERARLNNRQNHISGKIYKQKHDLQHRHS